MSVSMTNSAICLKCGNDLYCKYCESDDHKYVKITDTQILENQEIEEEDIEEIRTFETEKIKFEISNNRKLENLASSHEIENIEQSNNIKEDNFYEEVKKTDQKIDDIVEFMSKVDQYVMKNDVLNEFYKCPLCNNELPWYGEGVTIILDNCNHLFCRYCISDLLENIINYKTLELKCPYPECNTLIDQEKYDIEELVDPILYKKYLIVWTERLNNTECKIFHCKTFQCQGWCVIEGYNVTKFLCPVCKKDNDVNLGFMKTEYITDQEQNERYEELVALTENKIVPNFEPFECPICLNLYKSLDGLILKNCLHTFCRECISYTVNFSTDVEVKCPYKDNDYSCNAIIEQCEIKEILKPVDFKKYLERSIIQAEAKAGQSAFHCKTPDCPGWCIYESDVDNFTCPVCEKTNCLRCKMIHKVNCVEDMNNSDSLSNTEKSDLLINQMIEKGDAMLCPKCEAVIMKISGCDIVICTVCRSRICWATRGFRWGPNGIGDTSGGCKCTLFNKCHPSCHNCH